MSKMIFINLPVADLPSAMAFYEALGVTNNPQFTDETAACMVVSETIHVMLLTSKTIPDAQTSAQVLLCLSADSKDEVSGYVEKAVAAGGKGDPTPTQDLGFMYGRSFEDLDGHIWEVMWMDMAGASQVLQPAEAA
jgi:uncharacterized protein